MSFELSTAVRERFSANFNRLLEPEIPAMRERSEHAITMLLAANDGMSREQAIKVYAAMIGDSVCRELACRAPYMLEAVS